jgi:hypothetical protein
MGTRFLPATKVMPKELLPIIDQPLIQYAVEEAIEAGIRRVGKLFARRRGPTQDGAATPKRSLVTGNVVIVNCAHQMDLKLESRKLIRSSC